MSRIKIIRGVKDENSFYVESNYGPMLFDNGASMSQILRSDRTARLEKRASREGHGALGSKMQDIVLVPSLVIGGIVANNQLVALDDRTGLLGNDILKNYAYTLDTDQNEIELIEPFKEGIPCEIGRKGHLYVRTQIAGTECTALLDTGASCSLIDHSFCAQHAISITEETETGEDWSGATCETPSAMIDSLCVGGERFPRHKFAVLDFKQIFPTMEYPIVAILGASTFSCRKFSFNHIDGRIKIHP